DGERGEGVALVAGEVVDQARDAVLGGVTGTHGGGHRRLAEATQWHRGGVRNGADALAERVDLMPGHRVPELARLDRDPLHAEADLTGRVVDGVLDLVAGVVALRGDGRVERAFAVRRQGWPYRQA